MRYSSLAILTLSLNLPLAAQCDFGIRSHTFPDDVESVVTDGNVPTWLVTVKNHPNEIWGGSLRTQKPFAYLKGSNPFEVVLSGRRPFVVQERTTGNFYGLNWYGDFVPLKLSGDPGPNAIQSSQDLMCVVDGTDVHVFAYWAEKWETITTQQTPAIILGRGCLNVIDGNTIYGFSMATLGKEPPAKFTANSKPQHIAGTGESDTRRNQQAFETNAAGTQAVIYSAFTHRFHPVSFTGALPNFEYDKNTVLMQDPGNKLLSFFSAHSGQLVTGFFPNYANIIFNGDTAQDNGIAIFDPIAEEAIFYRGIDDGVVTLKVPGFQADDHNNNNWLIVSRAQNGDNQVYGVSSTARGSDFVAAGLAPGESVLKVDGNDMTGVVGTDREFYGYSSFSGKWARVTYKGTYDPASQKLDAEDFFGYAETSTHVYAYNPRTDSWHEHQKGTNYKGIVGGNEDQHVVIDEDDQAFVFSMESTGFRQQSFTGTRFMEGDDGQNSCFFFIYDNPTTNGSTVYWWQGLGDRWLVQELANRIDDKQNVLQLEDGMLAVDGKSLHTFSGFGDLSTDYSAPNDNNAYQAIPGSSPKFIANGRPGATAFLLVGINRVNLSIPPWRCNLLVTPLIVQPMGVYGADGTLRFSFTIPQGTTQGVARLQMASGRNGALELGRLLNLELF